MNLPSEITALVRASTETVKTFRQLQQARTDEASEKALKTKEGAMYRALEAQHDALRKVLELAQRPSAPLDLERMAAGVLAGLAKVRAFTQGVKEIGDGPRVAGRTVKPVIDVEPVK